VCVVGCVAVCVVLEKDSGSLEMEQQFWVALIAGLGTGRFGNQSMQLNQACSLVLWYCWSSDSEDGNQIGSVPLWWLVILSKAGEVSRVSCQQRCIWFCGCC